MRREDQHSIAEAVKALSTGGVVMLPTDTVYGLAVLPAFPHAIDRLYALKRRPKSMNLPIMVSSAEELDGIGFDLSEAAYRLLRSPLIPGSLTIAAGFRPSGKPTWLDGRDEAAVRIPNDQWLLAVLREVGPALVTSANLHGAETPESMQEVLAQLIGSPDLAVDGGNLQTIPSTLVNCRRDPPVVERVGAIPEAVIMEYLK